MSRDAVDLSVVLGKIKLKNPVMTSSGTFGYGEEYSHLMNLNDLGAIVVNRVTLKPKMGNFQHRCIEFGGTAFLTTTGQQNLGIDNFVKEKLPFLRQFDTPVIVNIAGSRIEDYARLAEILNKEKGVSGLEVNMVCPNLKEGEGGAEFSARPETVYKIVKGVRDVTDLNLTAKVSQSVTDITIIARACEEAGANAVLPGSGRPGMAIDIKTRRSKLGKNLTGALTGPMMKPVALRLVWQVARAVKIPVVGCGGITCAEDALEFFIAGATAIEIGSYIMVDPQAMTKTVAGIKKYLLENGHTSMKDIIGTMVID